MDNEDLPYNLDEFFADDPGFFNVQDLAHYPPPLEATEINDSNCPSNTFNFSSFGEILNRPPQLEKGDSSTHPHPRPLNLLEDNPPDTSKVLTKCISTQDQSSKDYNQDYGAQHHRHHQPPALTSRLTHSVSQKRRRDRVKEKMKTLKDLIPNCDKKGMASVLDEAIKYIKSLKLQTQYYGWYQQQVQARTWGGGQIPVVSPVASSLVRPVRAPPYLQYYDLHQQQMVIPYHPMLLMQPSQPIPQISTTSTSTSTVEID